MTIPRRKGDEEGFTLVELAVYSLLIGVVIAMVGGLIISVTMTQRTVSSVAAASNEAQVAADSIATGVRNSSAFLVTTSGSDQILQARIAQGSGTALTYVCAAWYYSSSNDTIRYRQSTAALGTITASSTTSWLLVTDGVEPTTGTGIFVGAKPDLSVSFTATAGDNPPAQVSTKVTVPSKWTGGTCFTA